jgi:hypothetical protein
MSGLAGRVASIAVVLVIPSAATLSTHTRAPFVAIEGAGEGREESVPDSRRPTVVAAFTRESYRPEHVARLVIADQAPSVTLQIYRAGTDRAWVSASDVMTGTAVTEPTELGRVNGRRAVLVTLGSWASGVYFAKLTAPGGRVGYAPFVLAPRVLGGHEVAVVIPTQTWQAYNFRDDDHDGRGDTWYAGWRQRTARLGRPFLNRGTPPHWKSNDLPFLQWLEVTGHDADYLADSDLRAVKNGSRLRGAYKLVVFPSHHEYVTTHEYNVIGGYRNRGGHLIFLSANNFFWRITRRGNMMTRTRRWRDLGRPEAALIGVEYFRNDRGQHRAPWVVRPSSTGDWLLSDSGLAPGSRMASGGIEADGTTTDSPRNITIVAEIPDLYGPGLTAQMTYYETRRGAQVFAAGAFGFTGASTDPRVSRLLANLWRRLAGPPAAQKSLPRRPETLTTP